MPHLVPTIPLHCDSQATIARAKSKNNNEKRRYILIRCNTINHLLMHCVISLDFQRSEKNIEDPLKKRLACRRICGRYYEKLATP